MDKRKSRKNIKVALLGNRVLTQKTTDIKSDEITSLQTQKLISNLISVCKKMDGVGIAAPQISVSKSIFILAPQPNARYPHVKKIEPIAVINPKILKRSVEKEKNWEGCLSVPEIRGLVSRHRSIQVSYSTLKTIGVEKKKTIVARKVSKKYTGFIARVFQHEYDHLKGILFIDRTKTRDLYSKEEFKKMFKKQKQLASKHREK